MIGSPTLESKQILFWKQPVERNNGIEDNGRVFHRNILAGALVVGIDTIRVHSKNLKK